MNHDNDNVIGIVGGMGPEAGLMLYNRLITHTNAGSDHEHLSVILMSFSKYIADRTSFLTGETDENPAYCITDVIMKLERAGARIVGMACNTSHAPQILDVIQSELAKEGSAVRLLNMPEETVMFIKSRYAGIKRIGLMSTNGTYKAGIYKALLKDWSYDAIIPDFEFQNNVIHKMIYDPIIGIKSNAGRITKEARLLLDKALCFFKENKADAIILGCTELSLMFNEEREGDIVIVDSLEALAFALIRESKSKQMEGEESQRMFNLVSG